jgi:hypothetical protein
MLAFEVESGSTVFRVLTRQMLYVVLWSVFHTLSMNTDRDVAVTASNALAGSSECLAHRDVLPTPLSVTANHKLPALFAASHQITRHVVSDDLGVAA